MRAGGLGQLQLGRRNNTEGRDVGSRVTSASSLMSSSRGKGRDASAGMAVQAGPGAVQHPTLVYNVR
jgi:hypothetical protein